MRSLLCCIFLLSACVLPLSSEAATLYMDPAETEIYPGDTITIAVRVDTDEDECINVVDGVIEFTSNIAVVDVSRGESILPVWVEDPTIDSEQNIITFAGGIPNGYCGRIDGDPRLSNIVLEIALQAPGTSIGLGTQEKNALINFAENTRVLLNDGRGTSAALRTFGSTVRLHDTPNNAVSDEWNTRVQADDIPPGKFSIALEHDPSIFSGRYFVVFNTTDKQTGIDHYEVIEEPLDNFDLFSFGAADAPWIRTESPYLLKDQSLNSTIRVKAVDKAGNEYIATLVPDGALRSMSQQQMIYIALGVTGGLVLLVLLAVFLVFRKRKEELTEAEIFPHESTYEIDE